MLKSVSLGVSKRGLLLEAAIVWMFAGGMLLFKGSTLLAASSAFSWFNLVASIGFGLIFFIFVFSRISHSHIERIINLHTGIHRIYEFFSLRSYLMMLSMISLGIFLRKTSFFPSASLSLAYIAMGIPLLFSSLLFYHRWFYYLSAIDTSII